MTLYEWGGGIKKWFRSRPRIRTWRCKRQRRLIREDFDAQIEKAKSRGAKREEIDDLRSNFFFHDLSYIEALESIATERLLSKARTLRVPVPAYPPLEAYMRNESQYPDWYFAGDVSEWVLSKDAYWRIYKLVKDELRARRDGWISIISVLIALGAIIVAILALLKP
jgi:hypothetical protein